MKWHGNKTYWLWHIALLAASFGMQARPTVYLVKKTPATLLASPQKYDEAFIHLGMNISNEKSIHPDLQNLSLVGWQDNRGKAPQNKEVSYFWLVYM